MKNSKKSMALFSFEFPPRLTGGIGKVAAQKYLKFKEYGYTVHLVAPLAPMTNQSFCYSLPIRNNFVKTLKLFFWGLWIITRFSPRFIYCLSGTHIGAAVFILYKFFRVPYFVMAHGYEFMRFPEYSFISKLLKTIYNNAAAVFAVSNFTKKALLKQGVREQKVYTVYNGISVIDTQSIKTKKIKEEKHKLHILPHTFVLLTISRLDARKGHDKVLESLKNIFFEQADLRKHIVYIIGGSGPEEQKIKKLIHRYELTDNVIFYGFVPEEKLPLLYTIADLFIMPNIVLPGQRDAEGFGLVFLEAAKYGTPSIGGKHGGSAEAIIDGETGFLVDGNNVKEIKEKILVFYNNRFLCKSLGQKAKKLIFNRFSIDRIFTDEYKQITRYLQENHINSSHDTENKKYRL